MLTNIVSAAGKYVLSGSVPGSGVGVPSTGTSPFVPDVLGRLIAQYENFSAPYDLIGRIGYVITDTANSVEYYIGRIPTRREGDWLRGYRKWADFVSTAQEFVDGWQFSTSKTIEGEHPVTHYNLFGNVESGVTEETFYRKPDGFAYEAPVTYPHLMFTLLDSATSPKVLPTNETQPGFVPYGRLVDILPELAYLVDTQWFNGPEGSVNVRFSDLEYDTDGIGVIALAYNVIVTTYNGNWASVFYWTHKAEFSFQRGPGSIALEGETYPLDEFVFYQVKHTWIMWQNSGYLMTVYQSDPNELDYGAVRPPLETTWTENPAFLSYENGATYFAHEPSTMSLVPLLVGFDNFQKRYYYSGSHCFSSFCAFSEHFANECYTAAFLACKDAVDKHFEQMSSNHIELMLEASDLFSFIDVAKTIRMLRRSKNKGDLLLSLLKILCDAKLTYSFALAPTVNDAIDISERAKPLYRRFTGSDYFKPHTINGKFVYPVPDSFTGDFQGVLLTARSKLRVTVKSDSFLSGLLPVRSLGLLPSLSTVWDCIPFSWLIDWLTHAGQYLDDVDTSAMMLALEVPYSVNSISISYEFQDVDKEQFAFTTSDEPGMPGAGYRRYERFVLNGLPPLAPTALPLHGQAAIPDWGVASSFLFKLLTR